MSLRQPSPLDQAVAACISILIGFTALYLAVRLIELIWLWLVGGLILLGIGTLAIGWYRGWGGDGW